SGHQKETAADHSCIFAGLVSIYNEVGLSFCGEGKWRNANGPLAAKRIKLYYNYFPELANLSLDTHSICSIHYNQIVINNQFYEHLVGSVQESQTSNFDTVEDNPRINITDSMNQLGSIQQFLELVRQENYQKSQLITELNGQIELMQQYIDEQQNEIEELKNKLQRAYNNMAEVQDLYDEQRKQNEALIEQWISRFSSQQKQNWYKVF
ncbi:hypothetical protein C2G38_2051292, partial [Gigaspora rosea]